MPRDIILDLASESSWDGELDPTDCVVVTLGDHVHAPRKLYETLKVHGKSLDYNRLPDLTLCVDYWTLVECRNTSFDDTREFSNVYPANDSRIGFLKISDEDGSRDHMHEHNPEMPTEPLTEEEKVELRELILKFPHLNVQFSCTCVDDWGTQRCAEWVGVLRTFTNISELDHSYSDKYGLMISEFLQDMYKYYGVCPSRILRLCGSDDNWDDGFVDDEARFATGADMGFKGSWNELIDHHDDYKKYGHILHKMAVYGFSVCSQHDFDGLAYFPNLRYITMNIDDIKEEALCVRDDGAYVLEIPTLHEVRDLSIHINGASLEAGSRLEIHTVCPRLRDVILNSSVSNISIVVCIDGKEPVKANVYILKKLQYLFHQRKFI
jgi:hypothetical protein